MAHVLVLHGCASFCKALRHRDRAHLMFVAVASDNENGDENGGRPARNATLARASEHSVAGGFRESSTLSRRSEAKTDRYPFSSPFSSTGSGIWRRARCPQKRFFTDVRLFGASGIGEVEQIRTRRPTPRHASGCKHSVPSLSRLHLVELLSVD